MDQEQVLEYYTMAEVSGRLGVTLETFPSIEHGVLKNSKRSSDPHRIRIWPSLVPCWAACQGEPPFRGYDCTTTCTVSYERASYCIRCSIRCYFITIDGICLPGRPGPGDPPEASGGPQVEWTPMCPLSVRMSQSPTGRIHRANHIYIIVIF